MNIDKYVYLIVILLLSIPWVVLYKKTILKNRVIKFGVAIAPFGTVFEYWHFQDYWVPPTLFRYYSFTFEDTLFSFIIAGISVSLYNVVFQKRSVRTDKKNIPFLIGVLFLQIVIMLFFVSYLGFNSIIVSSFSFLAFSLVIILLRNDLLIPSLVTGFLLSIIIIPIYLIVLNLFSPDYVASYFLLNGSKLGITVLGNFPLIELLWYFSWGCLGSILYEFTGGYRKFKRES